MVVERYVFIGRTIGVNCDQMMEFASKIKKDKPCEKDLPLLEKRYYTNLMDMICACMTDSTGLGLRISKRNLKDFMASIFQGSRQKINTLDCLPEV